MLFFILVLCMLIAGHLTPIAWTTYTDMLFFDIVGLRDGAVELEWKSLDDKTANPPVAPADIYSLMPADPPPIDLLFFRLERNKLLSTPAPDPRLITNYKELTENSLRIPMLPLFLLSCVWLTLAMVRAIRLRSKHGLCRKCGYDLKGNESGVCPECGSSINPNKQGV